jgi:hypothetical protein
MGWTFFTATGAVKGEGTPGADGAAGAAGSNEVSILFNSKPTPATGLGRRYYADRAMTLTNVYAFVADNTPTGTLSVDVYLNGVSVFSSGYATITAGNYLGSDKTPATTAVAKGDKLEVYLADLGGVTQGRISVVVSATYS